MGRFGVLVCLGFSCFGLVPWRDWRELKARAGHKYVCADDLARFGWGLDGRDLAGEMGRKLQELWLG